MTRNLFILVTLSVLALYSCKKKPEKKADPDIPVNIIQVHTQPVLYYDTYPATTEALSQVNLIAQVQGYITGIYFKEGSLVHRGQKLYEIDRRLYQASYDAAVANLKVSQGTLVQAKQDADRYIYLNTYNAVAKQLLDHAVITYQNAKNQVQASQEAVKTARTNLGYSIIYAPFDGTMGFSQVKIGNVVANGSTVLNTISTNNPIAVDFLVSEKQLNHFETLEASTKSTGRLRQGPAPLKLPDSLFTMLLPDNTLYPETGKLSIIDRAVDPQTGSIRIRLVFPNSQYLLRDGMSCIVRVHNLENGPQMLIPNKAVVEQMGEYFVFTARDSTIKNDSTRKLPAGKNKPKLMAFEKKVSLGQAIGANVIVRKGLKEGERLIIDGVQTLHDGAIVTTASKVAPAAAGSKR